MRKKYHDTPSLDGEYALTEMFYSYDLIFDDGVLIIFGIIDMNMMSS